MAFGYLSSRSSAATLKIKVNLPLVLTLSVLPDIDLYLRYLLPFVYHRGATHSVFTAVIAFAPFFLFYGKKTSPYFIAYVQHGLVGDYIAGGRSGVQLLWPLSNRYFGTSIEIDSLLNQAIEISMFLVALVIMTKLKDYKPFMKPDATNLLLFVPTLTVLMPSFLSTPITVPPLLIPAHIFYMILFAVAITIEIRMLIEKTRKTAKPNETAQFQKMSG
jgi:hypothetical protein